MTAKEKANELIEKYIPLTLRLYSDYDWGKDIDSAKQCALIAVDELLEVVDILDYEFGNELFYWQAVKSEIEKL